MVNWFCAYLFSWVISTGSSVSFYIQNQNTNGLLQTLPFVTSDTNFTLPLISLVLVISTLWLITTVWQTILYRRVINELYNTKHALESEIKTQESLQQNIIDISEREQLRIGHELHDGVVHDLTALGLAGDILQKEIAAESPELSTKLKEFIHIVDQSADKLRNIAKGLSPVNLDEVGLCAAIEQMVKQSTAVSGIKYQCEYTKPFTIANHENAIHIYRIVQEAVNNTVKHSHAKNILIAMKEINDRIEFTIQDDGNGFDISKNGHHGMGLYIMKYRAEITGAQFHIQSDSKNGTVIRFTFQEDQSTL